MSEGFIYLPKDASKARVREAENARKNRAEILRAYSQGKVSRRELMKWGLITAGGALAPIAGLSPFATSVYASGGGSGSTGSGNVGNGIPTGAPRSPLFGVQEFSTPMPRFDVIKRGTDPMGADFVHDNYPVPQRCSNQTQQLLDAGFGLPAGSMGPIEGRPPGEIWAHQQFSKYPPKVSIEMSQAQAQDNVQYNPGVDPVYNSGLTGGGTIPLKFHPGFPTQDANSVWTFNGTIPPKLVQGRYGEPILFRHHNKLPANNSNNGFGKNTISTHEHNGHHGAENDGFTGAFFFPNQFYDYHWPIVLAGLNSINQDGTDIKASSPIDGGGLNKVPGDWHETMSTHWFHDHMFTFTSQNVYKGNAAMFNIYSGLDRGDETVNDGVNLRLPSGSSNGKTWGNLDYDVNLMLAEKAFDQHGQLFMDIFQFDGFLGDVMTVNLTYKPFFEVERRKYRFRILNASVSRFFKVAIADAQGNEVPFFQIANDGNLFPQVLKLTELDEQGIAERYDIVVDFSQFSVGDKVWMVNLCEHSNGKKPLADLTMAAALSGTSSDPCVGKFLEFRIARDATQQDVSQCYEGMPMIPNPDLSNIPIARERTFVFGSGASQDTTDPISSFTLGAGGQPGPWGVQTDNGRLKNADFGRISAAPGYGTREVWHLVNGGGGWDHPIHIHFEEGQILQRNNKASLVPSWEKGRKDVYRLRPAGSVTITLQFRDWGGMYMEHCHNTVHEDNAMLVRWEIDNGGAPFLRPLPTPLPRPTGVTFAAPTEIEPTAF